MDKLFALVLAALVHLVGLAAILFFSVSAGGSAEPGGADTAAPPAARQLQLVRFAPPPPPRPTPEPQPVPVQTPPVTLAAVSEQVVPQPADPEPMPVRPEPVRPPEPEPESEPEPEPEPEPESEPEPIDTPDADSVPTDDPADQAVTGETTVEDISDAPATPTSGAPASAASEQPAAREGGQSGRDGRRAARAQRDYVRDLMAALVEHRVYPPRLMRDRVTGVVRVRFTIDRAGNVLAVSLAESSGSEALDQAALDVLGRADPLPAIPDSMGLERLTVTLPIEYSLITD